MSMVTMCIYISSESEFKCIRYIMFIITIIYLLYLQATIYMQILSILLTYDTHPFTNFLYGELP